ncbi:transposase [Rhodoferax koreense]|uniref:Transposase n=1 Tax=Rhodoferax koreensis TaxID=1842727 RepID=A0A1P8K008_9BURK|nr:transposase [Rhodoferax koreense]APW39325.1 transposase [Rhodoferax koreense]
MARLPRLNVPGLPHHVVQRGNNQQPVFAGVEDYVFFSSLMEENARAFRVAVHAYVWLPNQVQLLATPETEEGLPKLMQAVGRRYVRHFNDRQGRSGTLWEGRYRSTVLQPERHLLPCMALIDTAPVDAGEAGEPRDYPWSSHGHYVGLRNDRLVTPHALFWRLGNTPFAREAAYAELVQTGLAADERQQLFDAVLRGWALGDAEFVANLQTRTERRVSKSSAGRPSTRKSEVPKMTG